MCKKFKEFVDKHFHKNNEQAKGNQAKKLDAFVNETRELVYYMISHLQKHHDAVDKADLELIVCLTVDIMKYLRESFLYTLNRARD